METDEAVDRLAKVIEYFRSIEDPRSIWDQDGHGQQLRIWDHAEQEREIEAIAKALASQNPMLSEEETARILIYEAVVPHVHQAFGASDSNAKDVAEAVIVERARFERFTEIELPVLFLALKAPIEVAGVTFEPLDIDHFKESSMGKWTYGIYDGRLMAKGRLRSPGDGSKYLTNALEFIDSALRLLCGVVFPWQVEQHVVPAIPGSGPQPGATPFRTPSPYGTTGWTGSVGSLHRPGGSMNPHRRIEELWGGDAAAVVGFVNSVPTTDTERRLLTAFRWLGEACRAHDRTGRFVASVTALEALLAIRNDDLRTSAGVVALLAERAAFFAGPPESRLETHREVTRLYGSRSDVVHGRVAEVASKDIALAGGLAWSVARTLFQRREDLRSDADVSKWVIEERYRF